MGLGQLKTTEKAKTDVRCLAGRETRVATKLQEHTCLLTSTGRSHSAAAVGGDYHFLLGRLIPGPLNRDTSPLERKQKNLALELATKPCPPLPLSVWILNPSDERALALQLPHSEEGCAALQHRLPPARLR